MSALVILVPTSLVLGFIGLCCFIWSLRTKQYEDLDGAAERLLVDDPLDRPAARGAEDRVAGRDEGPPVA